MDEGLDTGPILLTESLAIGPEETGGSLHDRLAALGARLIVTALDALAAGSLVARPQAAEGACYAPKLGRNDGRLDWRRPANELARRVRALNPRPGAWCEAGSERLRVLAAKAVAGNGPPGQLLDDRLTIACGEGALRLLEIQRPGRAAMGAAVFLRGYPLATGTVLP
jgi:methionyl-tRNA formyltransferase